MTDNGDDDKWKELNHRIPDLQKRPKNEVVSEEHGLHVEHQLKHNGTANKAENGQQGNVQAPTVLQIPQQQLQGAMVCWERFLHVRSLKVLLVEDDDSTRHVLTALLRNCGYEVTVAANGLQAWKILEDVNNHIDLVLTEVVMPCLSGIGLLCKIISHITRQNVPVIMMSSHDSMGLVFKCLSKGAVDFLVKPIRKNELKNLWQHVWRRCHSSSGSGSESGTQTQKSVKSKSVDKSNNYTGKSDEEDNGSTTLKVEDESDDESGTQSSWTDAEVDSLRSLSQLNRVAQEKDEQLGTNQYGLQQIDASKVSEKFDNEPQDNNRAYPSAKQESDVANLTALIPKASDLEDSNNYISPQRPCNKKVVTDTLKLSSVNVGSKRPRVEDIRRTVKDDRNVLRRSDSSAFSRYHKLSNLSRTSFSNIRGNGTLDSILHLMKKGSDSDIQRCANDESSNECSNNIDIRVTTNHICIKPVALNTKLAAAYCVQSSALSRCPPDHLVATAVMGQARVAYQELGIQHQTKRFDRSHHHFGHNKQQKLHVKPSEKDGIDNASGSGSGNRVDQSKCSHREAALIKFRQKRKLRYLKRKRQGIKMKRLAER